MNKDNDHVTGYSPPGAFLRSLLRNKRLYYTGAISSMVFSLERACPTRLVEVKT
jgi:hypothetical protein